jgi:hypothetical protein
MKKPMFLDCVNCRSYLNCDDADTVHSSGCDEFVPELTEDVDPFNDLMNN